MFVQLHLVELTAGISILLGYKNHRHGTWAVCEASDCSTDWTKNVNNETVTMNRVPREENLHLRLLLSIHYFIWATFN